MVQRIPSVDFPQFPDPEESDADGLIAVSRELTAAMILAAYEKGIFPWFRYRQLVHWYSPPQRMLLFPEQLRISRSLKALLRKERFQLTVNHCFEDTIRACADTHRQQKGETWIDEAFINAYSDLHRAGRALSVEVWDAGRLVGGLYGVIMGSMFCGESIFSAVSDAGKVALVHLCRRLGFAVIDCQVPTPLLTQMGGIIVARSDFLNWLRHCRLQPVPPQMARP